MAVQHIHRNHLDFIIHPSIRIYLSYSIFIHLIHECIYLFIIIECIYLYNNAALYLPSGMCFEFASNYRSQPKFTAG